MNLLKFSPANTKLRKIVEWFVGLKSDQIYSFSLPSGFSCPSALDCFAKVPRHGGKLITKSGTLYRCYSASAELVFKQTRNMVWHNFDMLKKLNHPMDMANLIIESLPSACKIMRIHASGDFFNSTYFKAWVIVAYLKPNIQFYAYTKSLNYWVDNINIIPSNLKLIASRGGRFDNLIDEHNLLNAQVVYSEKHAEKLNLVIDYNEKQAITSNKNFALLIHGVQSKEQKIRQQEIAVG